MHAQLAAQATDHVKVAALDAELRAVSAQVVELEERWLVVAEAAG